MTARPGYPFYGECKGCGKRGHKQADCPKNGKGFKGYWHRCGIKGHSSVECPTHSKGKGKGSMMDLNGEPIE
jgi:hypothetical protein